MAKIAGTDATGTTTAGAAGAGNEPDLATDLATGFDALEQQNRAQAGDQAGAGGDQGPVVGKPADDAAATAKKEADAQKAAAEAAAAGQQVLTAEQLKAKTAELEGRTQELQQYETHLKEIYEDVRSVLNNPEFQAAYKHVAGQRGGPGPGATGPAPAGAGGEQAPDADALLKQLDDFKPETDNEKFLAGVAKAALVGLQKLNGLDTRMGGFEESMTGRQLQEAETAIETAKAGLGKDFEELSADPQKADDWEGLAARLRNAAALQGETLSLEDALKQAGYLLLRDKVDVRARQKVKEDAARAAAAGTETPGRATAPEPETLEQAAGRAYDEAERAR